MTSQASSRSLAAHAYRAGDVTQNTTFSVDIAGYGIFFKAGMIAACGPPCSPGGDEAADSAVRGTWYSWTTSAPCRAPAEP